MKFRIIIVFSFCVQVIFSQSSEKPKLVVGIVVDQMRAEYLYRFQDNYTENGFKRLIREGFNIKNLHYNYMPTATGPGHASIFSGTTPYGHGIVGNDWFDRKTGKIVNCVEDNDVHLVNVNKGPSASATKYARSPRRLRAPTISDVLKLFSNGNSKVVGISIKDRGAILPVGHLADYAFWYSRENGNFITSSYYSDKLPKWLSKFNNKKQADSLLNLKWEALLDSDSYANEDDNAFEKVFHGKKGSVFPYDLKKLRKDNGDYDFLTQTPYANTLLTEMAKTTIMGEQLGIGDNIDFLSISYSSTDYVGHAFGIRSKELEDTYIRMDREIGKLLDILDNQVGNGNYILFLTADHAASNHPKFLEESRLPGKFFDLNVIKENLNGKLSEQFEEADYVAYLDKTQIYLNHTKTPRNELLLAAVQILKELEGIAEVYVPDLHETRVLAIDEFFRKSYHSEISGDILMHFKPGWMPKRTSGTTHGTAYNDDTHVPLLWYGWNVKSGFSIKKHTITQIAPTLSLVLDVPLPGQSDDMPIYEILKD